MSDGLRGALVLGVTLLATLAACGEGPEGVTEPAVDGSRAPCIVCGDGDDSEASSALDTVTTALDLDSLVIVDPPRSPIIQDTTTTYKARDVGKKVHVRRYPYFDRPLLTDDLWTPSKCGAPSYELRVDHNDADFDGLHDGCEIDLAWEFRPWLYFHSNEGYASSSREPFFAVEPIEEGSPDCWQEEEPGARVSIIYMLGYHLDYAPLEAAVPGLSEASFEHWGDSEYVIVDVSAADRVGTWKVDAVWLSQHGETEVVAGRAMEYWGKELGEPGKEKYRGRPTVWVAEGKHANYRRWDDCDDGLNADRCNPYGSIEGPWRTGSEFVSNSFLEPATHQWRWWERNVGNSAVPLIWRAHASDGRNFSKGTLCVDEDCRALDQTEPFFLTEEEWNEGPFGVCRLCPFAGFTDADGVTGYPFYLAEYEERLEGRYQDLRILGKVRDACK